MATVTTQSAARLADRIDELVRELDALRDMPGLFTDDERADFHQAGDELLSVRDRLRGRRAD